MDLTTYANQFGTDKGTVSRASHSYTAVYDLLFTGRRAEPLRILEIGLSTGGPELGRPADRAVYEAPSIRMWHEFFPNAKLYGLDISDFSAMQTDWFSFVRADCGDQGQLERIADLGTHFDLIVDDGSHASFHQQLTLVTLFKYLRNGGLYVIEDLDWQPAHMERALPSVPTTTRQLRSFMQHLRFIPTGAIDRQRWEIVSSNIRNVLLIDDDDLYGMRRMYNRRHDIKGGKPHHFDIPRLKRTFTRGYLRRLLETGAQFSSALAGQFSPRTRSRVKLAVIHKC